ncbi:MAG: glycosyltransferase family 4 protein [Armatimonadetes bacterium]|nr:glycosyltransferase family 4 protein [Armatimonadota bacterium]
MRILYVGRNARIGGGSTFRLNVSRGLIARGHQIWLAALPGEVLPRYREVGVQYVWTPPAPWGGPWILNAIRKHQIDLVHASNTTPGQAAEWACLRSGTPMVMSIHGILGKNDHLQSCLQLARRIISFEEVAIRNLEVHAGRIDPNKLILLRRPIEHRPQFPREDGEFRVVGVGRLSRRKGQNALNLLAGFQAFRQTVPNSSLKLLGDGTLLKELRRAAASYNQAAGRTVVEVLGAVPEPVPIVGQAHVLVGASYCALEAIMQGVAVIGAGFQGYGPIHAENLRDAMAWNFGDVGPSQWEMSADNFRDALLHLHMAWTANQDRERYWRLDRLIEEDHALERVAQRLEAIYESVLRGEAPRREPGADPAAAQLGAPSA